jgi:FkbM family methyltransferase
MTVHPEIGASDMDQRAELDALLAADDAEAIEFSGVGALVAAPVVTVYMAAYKHEPYLAEAIEGVLAQETDFPIELIIGEDCSPDGTRRIAEHYQRRRLDMIRIVTGPRNLGSGRNIARGIARARGEFVAFCEGDDFWIDPRKLADQVALLRANPGSVLAYGNFAICMLSRGVWRTAGRQGIQTPWGTGSPLSGDLFSTIFSHFSVQTCTVMYRTSVVRDFLRSDFYDPALEMLDLPLAAYATSRGTAEYLDQPVAAYRISPGSATRRGAASQLQFALHATSLYTLFAERFADREDFDRKFADLVDQRLCELAFAASDRATFIAYYDKAMARSARRTRMRLTLKRVVLSAPYAKFFIAQWNRLGPRRQRRHTRRVQRENLRRQGSARSKRNGSDDSFGQIPLRLRGFKLLRGHTYYEPLVRMDGFVIDAGAHKLEFARGVSLATGCRVVAIEPNRELLSGIRVPEKVTVVDSALDAESRSATFSISDNPEASSIVYQAGAGCITLTTTTLQRICAEHAAAEIDLVKLDVEGAEYDILLNAPADLLARVRQISVEFHDFLDALKGRGLTEKVVERLAGLDFLPLKCSTRTNGDYLFVNRRTVTVGIVRRLLTQYILPLRRKWLAIRAV